MVVAALFEAGQQGFQTAEITFFAIGIQGGIKFDLLLELVYLAAKGIGDLKIDDIVTGQPDHTIAFAVSHQDQPLLGLINLVVPDYPVLRWFKRVGVGLGQAAKREAQKWYRDKRPKE
jgi:hypothetical protein